MNLELPEELADKIESLSVISLMPGDRLAVYLDAPASHENCEHIRSVLETWASVPVIVLWPGMKLEAVRQCQP